MEEKAIFKAVVDLIENEFVGVMMTIDAKGCPHARLMGAVLEDSDRPERLYSLSGHDTHKIEHLRRNPNVCWLFHTADHGRVVQLTGKAHVQATSQLPESAWEKLSDLTRPYAETSVRDESHYSFDVIESRLEHLELIGSDFGLTLPCSLTL